MLNKANHSAGMKIQLPDEPFYGDDLYTDEPVPGPPPTLGRKFRFCRMFPDLPPFRPGKDALIALGQALEQGQTGDHDTLPGGFTYLGQFIDHDITRDLNSDLADDQADPSTLEQGRSPMTDLDSLYGQGPALSPEQYETDGIRLRVGETSPTSTGGGNVGTRLPNDLPREADKRAIIGDPRNDENLAVAQTHLAFIKFHNRVVDHLETQGFDPASLFQEARKIVTQHYQSIILNDFLPRLVEPSVLDQIRAHGPSFFRVPEGELPCMPVEFSVAAYRLGHSMIRDDYEWNRVFETHGPGPTGTLDLLFKFSGVSGDLRDPTIPPGEPANRTLPTNWIIDWTRFYDFTDVEGVENHPRSNMTRRIDTSISATLKVLPEIVRQQQSDGQVDVRLQSLATRNLLRGRLIGLPSGQAVASAIGATPLTPAEVRQGDSVHKAILEEHGLDRETPLWYYVLKEAELRHDGQHLGTVGSVILAETFFELVRTSRSSILAESGWTPSLPSLDPNHFTMVDLLVFNDDLNPLG